MTARFRALPDVRDPWATVLADVANGGVCINGMRQRAEATLAAA